MQILNPVSIGLVFFFTIVEIRFYVVKFIKPFYGF